MVKRLVDVAGATLLMLLLLPVIVLAAIVVRLGIGSPILFTQQRAGLNGRIFTLYKFRTMTNERDTDGELLPDEKRLNRIGSFLRASSMDELPELVNVLKGEMSLVGPRPLLPQYLPLYNEHQARRHLVRPGLTGWAQVNGRNAATWPEKFDYDVWYVDNNNLLLDLRILLRTVKVVFSARGISEAGQATARPFEGNG
jgi:lipopolysaccharide/colanic/teichoic acid biosynthesis glycosyltransferase